MQKNSLAPIHAQSFVNQLASLSETVALKVDREGATHLAAPRYIKEDIFVQLRYAQQAYLFLIYLNADERREADSYWTEQLSIMGLPAVRTLIDCLYNITLVLEHPRINGERFRLSGLKKFCLNLDEDTVKYARAPEWTDHLAMRAQLASQIAVEVGTTVEQARKGKHSWDTLGTYLAKSFSSQNEHQQFMRTLALGSWRDYSALAHASFEGMIPHAIYFVRDILPQAEGPILRENFLPFITMHIGRAAGILLAILTEIQARLRFPRSISDR